MTKVLLIDDDDIVRGAMAMALGDCGYDVNALATGAAALAAIEQENPDVVMTDMKMPGFDGAALIQAIRARFPKVPVVAMSGDSVTEEEAAADAFLHKPFKLRDARAAIEKALHVQR